MRHVRLFILAAMVSFAACCVLSSGGCSGGNPLSANTPSTQPIVATTQHATQTITATIAATTELVKTVGGVVLTILQIAGAL